MIEDDTEETQATPFVILGRTIGTSTGWDDVDIGEFVVYGFVPLEQFKKFFPTSNALQINFNDGTLSEYNDRGECVFSVDMLALLRSTPRDTPAD